MFHKTSVPMNFCSTKHLYQCTLFEREPFRAYHEQCDRLTLVVISLTCRRRRALARNFDDRLRWTPVVRGAAVAVFNLRSDRPFRSDSSPLVFVVFYMRWPQNLVVESFWVFAFCAARKPCRVPCTLVVPGAPPSGIARRDRGRSSIFTSRRCDASCERSVISHLPSCLYQVPFIWRPLRTSSWDSDAS